MNQDFGVALDSLVEFIIGHFRVFDANLMADHK